MVNDATTLILASLASGERHGYAVLQDIEGFAGVRLGPGALHRGDWRACYRSCAHRRAGDRRARVPWRPGDTGGHGRVGMSIERSAERLL